VLAVLYREHAGDAFRYAVHLTGKRADAEDIVQHVFLQAHRHLESGRELVSPRAWLLTAVKHRAFNLARDRREVPVDDPILTVAQAETGGDEAGQLADVRAMLWTLPELQHQAFVLRHWNGLSQNEIAEVLGTTPSAVESLLRRARSGLLRAHDSASEVCGEIQHRLLDSAALGAAGEAHLQTCRPCRQAQTRFARATNLAGTLALAPGTHVADAITGLVPGFSPRAAAPAGAGAGTASAGAAGGAGAGGGASGAAAWGTTTAVTTVSKVVVVAKAAAAIAAATVAVGAIPPAHHALSAVLAGHTSRSEPRPARAAASTPHTRRGDHGAQAQPRAAREGGTPGIGKRERQVTPPGKHRGSGRGAGASGKPAGTGDGPANGKGNGKALGAGGGNAGSNREAPGTPAKAGGGSVNAGGGGRGAGKPPGVGGNGHGKALQQDPGAASTPSDPAAAVRP
jgi:RNA polymerase sigma factor (sigma-70 family)